MTTATARSIRLPFRAKPLNSCHKSLARPISRLLSRCPDVSLTSIGPTGHAIPATRSSRGRRANAGPSTTTDFPRLVRLPDLAGLHIQCRQPAPAVAIGVDALQVAQVEDLAGL